MSAPKKQLRFGSYVNDSGNAQDLIDILTKAGRRKLNNHHYTKEKANQKVWLDFHSYLINANSGPLRGYATPDATAKSVVVICWVKNFMKVVTVKIINSIPKDAVRAHYTTLQMMACDWYEHYKRFRWRTR